MPATKLFPISLLYKFAMSSNTVISLSKYNALSYCGYNSGKNNLKYVVFV